MATNRIAYAQTTPLPWHGTYRNLKAYGGALALAAADTGTPGNTVQLFSVPKGFTVTDLNFDCTRLDNNGTPTLTLSIGDAGQANRLVSASTIGQAAESEADPIAPGGLGYKYPADTDIQLSVTAAAATPAAGTLTLFLKGFIDA